MSNTIKLKRSSVATSTPTAGSLEYGELALNYTDGNLFFKTDANVVTLLASTRIANYSGNVAAGNLSTGGSLSVTGNATVGNISVDIGKSIDVGNNRIMNVAEPVANTDAATKSYVDSITSSGFTVQDDTANTTVVSAGDTLQLYGTANEVTVGITTTDQVTFGLPDNVTVTGNLSAGNLSTTGLLSVSGNASAGNISTAGKVTASGNVAGSYFIGDGSFLTNLPAQAGNAISNGTSNVAIPTSSGNVTVGINGTANTVVISPGSIFVNGLFASPKTITSNVQMAADSSAAVISPLTIGNGYSMSIPTTSTVYVWIPS